MKILQVYHIFPALFGGVSRIVYQISKELTKRRHIVHVLTTNAYFTGEENWEEGIKVHRFSLVSQMLSKKNLIIPDIKFIMSIKRLVKEYDCIHLHGYRNVYNVFIYHYAKKYGVPYVLQAHGSLPRIIAKKRLKWIFDVFFGYTLLRGASKIIALNQIELQQYRDMGVSEDKIEVIPNGIDLSEYGDLPSKGCFKRKFEIEEDKKMIFYLGRIHESKGIDLLMKAYAYLIYDMKFKDAVLVVAGPDDGFLTETKVLVSFLGISDSVIFVGFISSEDKLKALVDADVFVSPSFYGFPITFLEACATGTPIVTTTFGDTLEWINANVGYVTQPKYRDLAKAIHNVISNDELHKKLSTNCFKMVKNKFSIEYVVDSLKQTYEEIVYNKCK